MCILILKTASVIYKFAGFDQYNQVYNAIMVITYLHWTLTFHVQNRDKSETVL
jgi:hypothetical protein